jgi:hypothetical protein
MSPEELKSKDINAQIARLLDLQSQRLDRADRPHEELLGELKEFRTDTTGLQKQALHLLNLILDRLPGPPITA